MKLSTFTYLATTLSSILAIPTYAGSLSESEIKDKFEKLLPFKVNVVTESPLNGYYQLESEKGIFYASFDGKYIISGSIHQFEEGMLNYTALRQLELAKEQLNEIKADLIVFPAANEKHRVTVFTDPTCGYCVKLHSEVKEYNALGITIAYAAFPRGGIHSEMGQILTNVWCSENKQLALTNSKNNVILPNTDCENPVQKMHQIGENLGINGTPAIVLENGEIVPGYQAPENLLETLESAL